VSYIPSMEWEVEFTSEFEDWWNCLSEDEQADVNAKVILLPDQAFRGHMPT
jgi:hypothetical protein